MMPRRCTRRLLVLLAAAGLLLLYLGWRTTVSDRLQNSNRNATHFVQATQQGSLKAAESFWPVDGHPTPAISQEDKIRQRFWPVDGHPTPAISQEDKIRQRFQHRLSLLHRVCHLYNNTPVFHPKQPLRDFFSLPLYRPIMNVSVRFCPLAKVATTTWRNYLTSVTEHMDKMGMHGSEDLSTADDEVYFTFIREPYARMLSAYVDKLMTPIVLYWNATGRFIVNLFRKNATEKSLKCGHDVTFPEFVQYVVDSQSSGKHRNVHFIPAHDQCDMCTLPYRYIGHLETIKEDMPFIIKAIQSPVINTANYDHQTIVQNSQAVLWESRTKDILRCMDLEEAGRRLWKKFQIRGLISKTEKFPFKRGRAAGITLSEFVRMALAAHRRSQKNPHLKEQRREALREAFAQVPLVDRIIVQRILFLDFQMFGFDPMLEDVFPRTPYVPDKSFSYFNLDD